MRDAPRTGRAARASGLTLTAVVVAVTVVAAVAGGWTSRADAGSRLWVANPYVKLQEATRPAPWKAALVAPRGGRAAFQVVLDRAPKAQPRAGVLSGPAGARSREAPSRSGASSRCPSPSARAPSHTGWWARSRIRSCPLSARPQPRRRARSSGSRSQVPRTQAAGTYRGAIQAGGKSARLQPARRRRHAPARRALHTWFLVWSAHADDAEHRAGAGPRLHARARPLRHRRRHRGRRRRGNRRPARQHPRRRLGR